ncbi:MAG: hypothetical protein AB3K77_03005 [Methanosarcinaceae archaeon]
MKIRYGILIPIALLGILYLAGSASAAVDFPADEAGISAYVKAGDSIDINSAKPAFATIERETSDYIIGTVALDLHTEEEYPHVYVSTDGWIVAYYPRGRPSSWLFPWNEYNGGKIPSTTLSKAVGIVADGVGGNTNDLKYYDFKYPDASKMMFIMESVTSGTNSFKVTIPTTFTTYVVDWSHYAVTSTSSYTPGSSNVYLDGGTSFSAFGRGTKWDYGSLLGQFENGVEHEVKITTNHGTGRIGLVLEYAE